MKIIHSPFFKKYLLPGIIFQSVVIAGGYGTGREIVEFFLRFEPLGGLLAMLLVSTVLWSLVCAATFEFARVFRAYDYRTFFKALLGKFWFLFEICYLVLLMIILAVIASSAGSILEETLGWNYYVGVVGMMACTGVLVFKGGKTIETILSYWSFFLYAVFIAFVVFSFAKFGNTIMANLFRGEIREGWIVGGLQYAFYNLGVIPTVLFATRHIETRKEALCASGLAGVIGIVPGLMIYLSLVGQYPGIVSRTVPINFILGILGFAVFQLVYQAMLFGTLIETSTGCIHAVNERVRSVYDQKSKPMPPWVRPALAIALLVLGALIARFGLIGLIAQGYGSISWGFLLVFVLPVLTLGIWKIARARKAKS